MASTAAGLPRIDVYTLRLFLAVAEEGSIARAATRESIAASALSRRLADLEHTLRAPLLMRSARGIELTDAGRYVVERAQRIEHDLHRLVQDVWSISGAVVGTVRLYANPSAIVGFLPERLRVFSDAYPEVSIELTEQRSRDVIRACLDDRADVGIAVEMEVSSGLDAWRFASDPLIVLLPVGHALANAKHLKFLNVVESGLVSVQAGGALDQLLRGKAAAAKVEFKPKLSVDSFDAACRMVEAGLGVAIVPTSAATAFAGTERFVRRELREAWAARDLVLYALQKQPRAAAVDALIRVLRAQGQESVG